MYLDTGTMIAIMIALVASILTIGYSIYIIKTQNEIIQRMSACNHCNQTQDGKVDSNENREELLKIKEAFAYAMMDMLDVYDELLATGRIYVEDEPTVNDLAKNQDESNA
jgi:hypothetical protein